MYQLRILDKAVEELGKLDKSIARRITNRLKWLAENFPNVRIESLSGGLSGFQKLRIGDYRVLYQVLHDDKIIVIHKIGHRKEIYRIP